MSAVLVVVGGLLMVRAAAPTSAAANASTLPGSPLSSNDKTPFPSSKSIISARWIGDRHDPPGNQDGDILPTVWGDDDSTYVLINDGGVDTPLAGAHWRQSLARVSGRPPNLKFTHVGDRFSPAPRTWKQIGADTDLDDGPLGPYYSIGFTEVGGVFYATLQRNWNWTANANYTGLVGVGYSTTRGETWRVVNKPFPAPLGNLTFIVSGGKGGGPATDGYVYAIGTEREFNASRLILGRSRPGVANLTDPARWQWYAGSKGTAGSSKPQWSSSLSSAVSMLKWNNHITYPQMTYDAALHRYLLTFTYSYAAKPPAIWKAGAELVILESPTPQGPFSFVASSRYFGPSNGYGAGFPAQWISANGQTLWLKWAANFVGCAEGLVCSGKYGFNVAKVQLTLARKPPANVRRNLFQFGGGAFVALLILAGVTVGTRSLVARRIKREVPPISQPRPGRPEPQNRIG